MYGGFALLDHSLLFESNYFIIFKHVALLLIKFLLTKIINELFLNFSFFCTFIKLYFRIFLFSFSPVEDVIQVIESLYFFK